MTSGKLRDPALVKAALERWLPGALGMEAAEVVDLGKPQCGFVLGLEVFLKSNDSGINIAP